MQCIKILNMIKLFGKPIRVNKSSQDKKSQDVGANLFIGHLDPDVDEKVRFNRLDAPSISLHIPAQLLALLNSVLLDVASLLMFAVYFA